MAYADGTFPIVFESGVLRFDDDGALHVHLTHSADAPHPIATHPEGSEGHVPGDVGTLEIRGAPTARLAVEGASFRRAASLPEGLVVTIRDWDLVKGEASGDLSVLVKGVEDPPDWLEPGMVHRFAGPDDGLALYFDTSPIPQPREVAPSWTPPADRERTADGGKGASRAGCGVLAAVAIAALIVIL